MTQNEKRNVPRFPVGDRENIIVTFTNKDEVFQGALWDYSRFGMGIFLEDNPNLPRQNNQLDNIKIHAFGQNRHLGRGKVARLIHQSGSCFVGLILQDEFIDLDSLLSTKTFRLHGDEVREMRGILANFQGLDSEFKEYASDFAVGLSFFKRRLDELDDRVHEETPSMRKSIFQVMEQGIATELWNFMDQKIQEMEGVLNGSVDQRNVAGLYLRSILWPYLGLAPFLRRVIEKPRGYAGDSLMMEMVYQNGYKGDSTFAKFLHLHPLRIPSAQAVRNRRGLIKDELEAFIKQTGRENVNVLSVACGPAWEMKDYLSSSPFADRVNLFLLDQDAEALDEARASVREGGRDPEGSNVHFVQESVRTLVGHNLPEILRGVSMDFIYTMGLFDYLTIPVSRALVNRLHSITAPGGVILVGNYTVASPDRVYMDYLMDWPLLYKSPEEMVGLANGLDESTKRGIGYEESGVQMFLKLEKGE